MNNTRNTLTRGSFAAAVAVALTLSACGSDGNSPTSEDADVSDAATEETAEAAGVTMTDPWSRQPADGQTATAVYGLVTNNTDEMITAVAASTSVSDTVELHEVLMNDEGQMSMQEKVGGYEIAAGESLLFEPGGAHIMLLDIDAAAYPDAVDVTLSFDDGTSIDFTAEVRSIDMDMDMDDMDHDSMEMDDDSMEMDDDSMTMEDDEG